MVYTSPVVQERGYLDSVHTLVVQVRASAALELEQVVNEVKRQVEKEKEIAVIETKKKKWVSA